MKVEVNFRRDKPNLGMLTSWELSNFLNTLSSGFYKNELLFHIVERIQSGCDPKNIVVLDNSFQYDKMYNDLTELDLKDSGSLSDMYIIGNPISMAPNQNLFHVFLIFDAFSSINRLFYTQKISRLSRANLPKFANTAAPFQDCIYDVQSSALDIIGVAESKRPKKDFSPTRRKVMEIIKKSLEKWKECDDDGGLIEEFIKNEQGLAAKINKEEYRRIKAAYFMPFFNRFNSLSRPLAGVYSEQINSISILGLNHVNRSKKDEEFFSIKSISHKNPVNIVIAVGLGLAAFLHTVKTSTQVDDELRKLDQKLNNYKRVNQLGFALIQSELTKSYNNNNDKMKAVVDKNAFEAVGLYQNGRPMEESEVESVPPDLEGGVTPTV